MKPCLLFEIRIRGAGAGRIGAGATYQLVAVVIAGLDPPAGPNPLRRREGPAIHLSSNGMDPRVKPAGDERYDWNYKSLD
jgi:hypothetical protein